MVLGQLVECDLEPAYPIAVTFPSRSEAIDALLGAKGGSPRVVTDETELAITDCASRGSVRSNTFGAVGHCCLLLVLSQLFAIILFSLAGAFRSVYERRDMPMIGRLRYQAYVAKTQTCRLTYEAELTIRSVTRNAARCTNRLIDKCRFSPAVSS